MSVRIGHTSIRSYWMPRLHPSTLEEHKGHTGEESCASSTTPSFGAPGPIQDTLAVSPSPASLPVDAQPPESVPSRILLYLRRRSQGSRFLRRRCFSSTSSSGWVQVCQFGTPVLTPQPAAPSGAPWPEAYYSSEGSHNAQSMPRKVVDLRHTILVNALTMQRSCQGKLLTWGILF